jgi:hypothetical protein
MGPPRVLFGVATTLAILMALDANSRQALVMLLIAAPLWLIVAATWLVGFLVVARRTRLRMSVADWARWVVIPVAMGLVFLLTRSHMLFDARLSLSRPALDEMAADVMAVGPTDRGWVGLYDVGTVEPTANGVRFVVDDSALYRFGLAYARDGEPELTEANYSPLWSSTGLKPLGGGWWLWTEEWD